jgi:hypothetical protein
MKYKHALNIGCPIENNKTNPSIIIILVLVSSKQNLLWVTDSCCFISFLMMNKKIKSNTKITKVKKMALKLKLKNEN